ncbi:MAG: hypothetical protein WBG89_03550 [Ornithinimicrobium sp.]
MNVSDVQYTAGLGGFLVLFGLGLVLWFLGRDLSRRLRRMRQQESLRQEGLGPPVPPAGRGDTEVSPAEEQAEEGPTPPRG